VDIIDTRRTPYRPDERQPDSAACADYPSFRWTITHLMAMSLMLTGFLQLGFTRYIADRLFEKDIDAILPNFIGSIFVTTLISGLFGMGLAVFAFRKWMPYFAFC